MAAAASKPWTHAWGSADHLALLLAIAVALAAYAALIRGLPVPGRQRERHALWFFSGLLALYLAEFPPLHTLAEHVLLSAHMVQHMLLMLVLPVGVLKGIPPAGWARLIRRRRSRRAVAFVTRPLAAFVVFHFILSAWHVPALYDLALRIHWVHGVEHAAFILGALIMWWPLLQPHPDLPSISPPARMLYLFGLIAAPMAITGPLVFIDEPAYAHYVRAPRPGGLALITDQQVAGLLMKFPSAVLFGTMFCRTFLRWAEAEQRP